MNRKPRTCTVCNKRLTAGRNYDPMTHESLCLSCFEDAGLENEHMDGFHDDAPEADCPMCGKVVEMAKTGHTNTAPKSHGSHAECYAAKLHDKSPAGRAACRKARTN